MSAVDRIGSATPEVLARRFQAGERQALDLLYAAVEPVLRVGIARACRRGLPEALQRVDLEQESWLILATLTERWEQRPNISFAAYLGRVFPWALARYVRAHSPERRSQVHAEYSWTHERLVLALDSTTCESSAGWDDQIWCADLLRQVEPRARAALWLHAAESRPFTEVARALGVPRATAFDLYRRGLEAAREAA